jgi:hypothetical protein
VLKERVHVLRLAVKGSLSNTKLGHAHIDSRPYTSVYSHIYITLQIHGSSGLTDQVSTYIYNYLFIIFSVLGGSEASCSLHHPPHCPFRTIILGCSREQSHAGHRSGKYSRLCPYVHNAYSTVGAGVDALNYSFRPSISW